MLILQLDTVDLETRGESQLFLHSLPDLYSSPPSISSEDGDDVDFEFEKLVVVLLIMIVRFLRIASFAHKIGD